MCCFTAGAGLSFTVIGSVQYNLYDLACLVLVLGLNDII